MISLIVADLDGTIVHKNHVSTASLNAIQYLKDNNILFTIASGRHPNAMVKFIQLFHLEDIPVIANNGAYLGFPLLEKTIQYDPLSKDSFDQLLMILNSSNSDYLLYSTKRIIGTIDSSAKLKKRIGEVPIEIVSKDEMPSCFNEGILKILVIEEDELAFASLYQKLIGIDAVSVVSSQSGFIDLGSVRASKGKAFDQLCGFLKINSQKTLTIGDHDNDISLIEASAVGVAMGNASKELKRHADYITKSCAEDGFSYAIYHFVQKEKRYKRE